ncbi:CPSF A subunit region-domain-containing protein [Sphaerosporella brunnea]|uniref:CPSF A subunit region-domain-containing protein n=1 Tax=Sphaerosporella brunnea TaxID=1250544 RepID=A0A5J5F1A7_9PEZI|nr:CPSF A subunit region-domain-containing protein [Sphaerosporella brunnea]
MPEIYTELTPPTSVTHSLTLPFTSRTADNLLVAKTNILQIFKLTTVATEVTAASSSDDTAALNPPRAADEEQGDFSAELNLQRSKVEDVAKLVLVAEFPLAGEVMGMARVTPGAERCRGKAAGDMVLLAVRDAKMSLILWDAERQCVETVSLHYYEREEFASPVVGEGLPSQLVADPGMRAVTFKFSGDMLAVLPVRQEGEDEEMLDTIPEEEDVVMAEDDDDWDPSAPGVATTPRKASVGKKKEHGSSDLPFLPSFVVSASQLDDAISHVLSLTFLHEYREPTLGILYSPKRTWTGWLEQRKDTICYIVITLDLEQKASTPIISVQGLPYDLFKVVPLTPPIGGSLLLGANEIIHVDQAGKTTGVAVNHYAKRSTNFANLADQSDYCLALEGSTVVELEGEGGDLLLITKDGTALIVGFRMDGRNVSGVKITKIASQPGSLVGGRATTAVSLGGKKLFVGCDEGDARVLKWKRKGEKKTIKPGLSDGLEDHDVEDIYDMLDDVDDDLYGGSSTDLSGTRKDSIFTGAKTGENRATGEYMFQTHDRIINLGPFRGVTMGRPTFPPGSADKQRGVVPELELITTSGPTDTPEDAGMALIRRSVAPTVIGRFGFQACKGLWTVKAKSTKSATAAETAQATGQQEATRSMEEEYDRYLFVSKESESAVFKVRDEFEEVRGTDFDADGATVEVGVVGEGTRIVQVVSEMVRVYDCDMQLTQIVPMFDEETGEDGPPIVKARVLDPWVILLRADGSMVVYKLDKSMELAEEKDGIKGAKFKSASLYKARNGEAFSPANGIDVDHVLALMTENQALQIYALPNLHTPIFTAEHFSTLPPLLRQHSTSHTSLRTNNISATEDIAEILLADLGDHVAREPYLIVRNVQDDITFYKAFSASGSVSFVKTSNPVLATPRPGLKEAPSFRPMVAMENVSGYACVFLPGADPAFMIKTAKSVPRLHRLAGTAVRALTSFNTASADRGFVYVDVSGSVRVSLLPQDWNFDNPFHAKKVYLNESLRALTWYDTMNVCIAATTRRVPFSLEEEDGKADVDGAQLQPQVDHGTLAIISPLTWTVVDRYVFAHNEVALVVQTISLEVSEHTKERKQLVAVGTGIFRGEDHSARGGIYVFEVIEVVPEPGKPETNRKLKLVTREEVKGTVSALCGVNGYLLAAQGQKIMVRGLKEDQSLLPVAFMDMNCYVTVAKSLGGLVLFGDFTKSVWFTGFSEEPYKMTLFGKDTQELQVVTAEFLPDGRQLCFIIADANGDVHVLQYDPEHPKSLAGQRLIHRCAFHVPHEITNLTLLPRASSTPSSLQEQTESHLLLAATRNGSLALITTVPENSYRRLNQLMNQVIAGEEHTAGLNPKAFRHVAASDRTGEFLRGVLDHWLLERWVEMPFVRKREVAERAGLEVDAAREWVRGLGEAGLAYL